MGIYIAEKAVATEAPQLDTKPLQNPAALVIPCILIFSRALHLEVVKQRPRRIAGQKQLI